MRISDWSSDGCSSDLVTTARPLHNDDVVAVPLFEDTLAVVARAGHPLVREGVGSLADLGRYPWILPRYGTPTPRRCDALLQPTGGVVTHGLLEPRPPDSVSPLLPASASPPPPSPPPHPS